VAPNRRRPEARRIATAFVEAVAAKTYCAHCGAQPVEWHHPEHPEKPHFRVSSLRAQGNTIARIQREMDRCTPLCRSCHMREDGRLELLRTAGPYKKGVTYVPPKPCVECGKLTKPTRRGRCQWCYAKFMGIRGKSGS
jgi:deoxycytidylate deaminase